MKISEIQVTPIHPQRWGDDMDVVDAARVSFAKESWWVDAEGNRVDKDEGAYLREEDKRLIRYLARHKHTSPFNHSFIKTRVKAPIFVARQLV